MSLGIPDTRHEHAVVRKKLVCCRQALRSSRSWHCETDAEHSLLLRRRAEGEGGAEIVILGEEKVQGEQRPRTRSCERDDSLYGCSHAFRLFH